MDWLNHVKAALVAALATLFLVSSDARAQPESGGPAEMASAEERLGIFLSRGAGRLLGEEPLQIQGIELAMLVLEEAFALSPNDPYLCRHFMKMATLAERDDLYAAGLQRLVQLDPDDEVARLSRLNLALEKLNTAEERVAAYQRLLDPAHRDRLGAAVSSRLYLDLALLEQRRGNTDEFGRALAEAVAIDPANRTAAAIAAGFFRMNVSDPYAEAELLVNMLVADPTDVLTQAALATHLLDHGAYVAAERIYSLAVRNIAALRGRARGDLLADLAIAEWANGKGGAALRTINVRQQEADEAAQSQAWAENPDLNPLERAAVTGTISPTLATVRAAIHSRSGDERTAGSVTKALRAYEVEIERNRRSEKPDANLEPRLRLEMAWVAVWLSTDMSLARSRIEAADSLRPLDEATRTRFDAWIALREGDADGAIERLRSLTNREPDDHLGLAEAYLALGQRREAARAYLEAARSKAGTVISIWAANALAELLERRVPLSEESAGLEKLVKAIPAVFDRYPDTPNLAIDIRVTPTKSLYGPLEPVIVNVEITNYSYYPLSFDREGPIRPQVILFTPVTLTGGFAPPSVPPMVIDIDRDLRIAPRQRIVIPVDLRRLRVGDLFPLTAITGMFIRVKAAVNLKVSSLGSLIPGLLSSEGWTDSIRVDGLRIAQYTARIAWIREAIAQISAPDTPPDLVKVALLLYAVAPDLPPDAPPEVFAIYRQAETALAAVFPRLGPNGLAWLVGITPPGTMIEPLEQYVRASDARIIRLMLLLFHLSGGDDPTLRDALVDDDDVIRRFAVATKARVDALARSMEMPAGSGGAIAPRPPGP